MLFTKEECFKSFKNSFRLSSKCSFSGKSFHSLAEEKVLKVHFSYDFYLTVGMLRYM